ncbi:MAG: YraN family protein [Candidatus Omnitrophota bacterium]
MNKGKFYEGEAVKFLKSKGYKILKRNFRSWFGEIDIIARDKQFTSFVEVKMRYYKAEYLPREAVDKKKRDKIRKTALFYSAKNPKGFFRFDVLEIIQKKDILYYNLIKDAFNMDE